MQGLFRQFANRASEITGTVWAFALATLVIVIWAITGPLFNFSDTWQLVINTGTTIVTFLMVFLIQNTQNRDNTALHTKLDELIVHTQGAHNELAAAEDFTEGQLRKLKEHFVQVSEKGGTDTKLGMNVDGLKKDAPSKNGAANASAKARNGQTTKSPTRRRVASHSRGPKTAQRTSIKR